MYLQPAGVRSELGIFHPSAAGLRKPPSLLTSPGSEAAEVYCPIIGPLREHVENSLNSFYRCWHAFLSLSTLNRWARSFPQSPEFCELLNMTSSVSHDHMGSIFSFDRRAAGHKVVAGSHVCVLHVQKKNIYKSE